MKGAKALFLTSKELQRRVQDSVKWKLKYHAFPFLTKYWLSDEDQRQELIPYCSKNNIDPGELEDCFRGEVEKTFDKFNIQTLC